MTADQDLTEQRQAAMSILAGATQKELDGALERFAPLPPVKDLRPPESGLTMVRGRIGGDGAPFNLGEATVTRAAVRIGNGPTGVAYLLGRDPKRARSAAILDALWQDPALRATLEDALRPIRARIAADEAAEAERTKATKVDFFTMVRGED